MLRTIALLAFVVGCVACDSTSTMPQPQPASPTAPSTSSSSTASTMPAGNTTGIGGAMPAYYDGRLFTINFTELPPGGETANLSQNGAINNIYQSDGCMPGGKMFVSVIDAVPTDGFNPLWREVQVVFNKTASCQQFTSDDAILAAAAAGAITLQPTNELYRCSVIGAK